MRARQTIAPTLLEAVINQVAVERQVAPEAITSRSKATPVVRARQLVVHRLRDMGGYSWPALGRAVNRDHTTAMHSYRVVEERGER